MTKKLFLLCVLFLFSSNSYCLIFSYNLDGFLVRDKELEKKVNSVIALDGRIVSCWNSLDYFQNFYGAYSILNPELIEEDDKTLGLKVDFLYFLCQRVGENFSWVKVDPYKEIFYKNYAYDEDEGKFKLVNRSMKKFDLKIIASTMDSLVIAESKILPKRGGSFVSKFGISRSQIFDPDEEELLLMGEKIKGQIGLTLSFLKQDFDADGIKMDNKHYANTGMFFIHYSITEKNGNLKADFY